MPLAAEVAQPQATSYSLCLAPALVDAPRRGIVHSAFATAANLVFPHDFVVSLNGDTQKSGVLTRALPFPGMPNGIQLKAFPFGVLRPGMPVLLGAGRLVIDAVACSLDLSGCSQWNPYIIHRGVGRLHVIRENAAWLARRYLDTADDHDDLRSALSRMPTAFPTAASMARALCGRGPGLTPAGDDMLVGWMALNWLLYGPRSEVIAACQEILAVARRQTHLLSQCWLGYAARGCAALPICALLEAMAGNDERQLAAATRVVLSMGATSGRDLVRGIVMGVGADLSRPGVVGRFHARYPSPTPGRDKSAPTEIY